MAQRGIQLVRTDDSVKGTVQFFDRRKTDVQQAFIARVSVQGMSQEALIRAAIHGITQNILDSSNKLDGDERVAYIKHACRVVQNGGWASAPVDEAAQIERAVQALVKLGIAEPEARRMATVKKG